jgi:alkaline phosphatase
MAHNKKFGSKKSFWWNRNKKSALRHRRRLLCEKLDHRLFLAADLVGDFVLTIVHNNDGESQLINAGSGLQDFGGVARFKTVVDNLRAEAASDNGVFDSDGTLTLSSGDNFLAGPEFTASLDNGPLGSRTYFDAIALTEIGYDAIQLGNHDFDFGPEVLADFIPQVNTTDPPYLAANLDFSNEPSLDALVTSGRIAPSTIVNVGGTEIGIVGAVTEELSTITSTGDVIINQVLSAVQSEIDLLRGAGVEKIVLISHLQSINEELALIPQLSGVDVVIAGGGDELLANPGDLLIPGDTFDPDRPYPLIAQNADGNNVAVVTTPGEYKYAGRLRVAFDASGNLIDWDGGPIRVAGGAEPDAVAPDPFLQANVVEPVAAFVADLGDQVIGESEVDLDGTRDNVRTDETNQGNLIADALLWQANQSAAAAGLPLADIALQNGGGIRNNQILQAGPITELDTFDMLPFSNFVTVVESISASQLKEIMENAVSRVEDGSGRFAQVSGMSVVYDLRGQPQQLSVADSSVITPGSRIRSITLNDGTELVKNGIVVPGAPSVNVATIDFLARGGDQYPFRDAPFTILGVSYQQALSNYIQGPLGGLITQDDYVEGGEGRLVDLSAGLDTTPTVRFEQVSTLGGLSGAEIPAFDPERDLMFVTSPDIKLEIVDLSDPANPIPLPPLDILANVNSGFTAGGVTSVAVSDGIVAVAVEAATTTDPGVVAFFNSSDLQNQIFTPLNVVEVGALPDMLTFTPDGSKVLVANEGEADDGINPEGSVSVIDLSAGVDSASVATADFNAFDSQVAALVAAGVRLFPGVISSDITVSQDLEPEYIAIDPAEEIAFVTLQEANAFAVVDFRDPTAPFVSEIVPLGTKDYSIPGNALDPSNRDGGINIANWPVFGWFMPDAVASFQIDGETFYISANEGDARDEDERISNVVLDPTAFPDAEFLQREENLGRLNISTIDGDIDGDGDFDQLYSYGGRSFTIWDSNGNQVFDSGQLIADITAELVPTIFNSDESDPAEFDDRSDDKGAEPEGVTVGQIGDRIYAFIGLERTGGILVFDVTNPVAPEFQQYLFTEGDRAPEGLAFIDGGDSPNGQPTLAVTNEASNTLTLYSFFFEPDSIVELSRFDDDVTLSRNGINLQLRDNRTGELLFDEIEGTLRSITIVGDRGDDTLNVDLTTGPINVPTLFDGGRGGKDTMNALVNGGDDLVSVDANVVTALGSSITYESVEFVSVDTGSGDDTIAIASSDARLTLKDSDGFDTLDFSNAERSLKIDLGLNEGKSQSVLGRTRLALRGDFESVIGTDYRDTIIGSPSVDNVLRGGAGRDLLFGKGGNNVLLGESGDDILRGGDGRDIQIGGTGRDLLFGGRGDDLQVGGTTSYDEDLDALLAILAEWTSERSFAERQGNLTNGGGENGSVVLDADTVMEDNERDMLFGGFGHDWQLSGRRDIDLF